MKRERNSKERIKRRKFSRITSYENFLQLC